MSNMRILIADGSEHDLIQGESYMVETYRDKAWDFLAHVEHWCLPTCEMPRPPERRIFIFDPKLVKKLISKGRADEYRRDKPGEEVFEAWDLYQANNITEEQMDDIANAPDEQLWDELEGWQM